MRRDAWRGGKVDHGEGMACSLEVAGHHVGFLREPPRIGGQCRVEPQVRYYVVGFAAARPLPKVDELGCGLVELGEESPLWTRSSTVSVLSRDAPGSRRNNPHVLPSIITNGHLHDEVVEVVRAAVEEAGLDPTQRENEDTAALWAARAEHGLDPWRPCERTTGT